MHNQICSDNKCLDEKEIENLDDNINSNTESSILRNVKTWDIPEIILEPIFVNGLKNPILNLNGNWKFSFNPPENAFENSIDFSGWDSVKVPGELLMQGYDIQMGEEYIYKKEVFIPHEFKEKRILLRFEGIYAKGRVWVNGIAVKEHKGGFTPWDCNITQYVKAGERAVITVGVTDLREDPSVASVYAHHNIGGILRNVKIIALTNTYIKRIHTQTIFNGNYEDAILKVTSCLGKDRLVTTSSVTSNNKKAYVHLELISPTGKKIVLFPDEIEFVEYHKDKTIEIAIKTPTLWDAENPNLYTLNATLLLDGEKIEETTQKVGFREIIFGGKYGTAPNKLYVNGYEVKLRGTCRHDVSFDLGRVTSSALDEQEIRAYKECNINYIRTSHYPPTKRLLELCDKYGMYVESETAVCFQGDGYHPIPEESYFMDQFVEMVEYNKSHPSVLIWSLGNESYWNSTPAFITQYEYIKKIDPTRPIKFSWGSEVKDEYPTDIFSVHYEGFGKPLGNEHIPVLHDEYAHVACYNIKEIARDSNVRNFWGESIKGFWDQIMNTEGALGGALWGGIDDIFLIPETTNCDKKHSTGDAPGYGEWGSIMDIYRRMKPEAWLVKKAYSPIRIDGKYFENPGDENELVIPVKNWFDHTNLSKVIVKWELKGEYGEFTLPDIAPHSVGSFSLPSRKWNDKDIINLKFFNSLDDLMIDEYNICLSHEKCIPTELICEDLSVGLITIIQTETHYNIQGGKFNLLIDKSTGLIVEGKYGNEILIHSGPNLHVIGMGLGKWKLAENGLKVEHKGESVYVSIEGSYNKLEVLFQMRIYGNGKINTQCTIISEPSTTQDFNEIGISFNISKDVSNVKWKREGLWSAYPENHIGRTAGTASKLRDNHIDAPHKYGTKPTWDWKDDMRNYHIYIKDSKSDGVCTNDFKTMRENIYYYSVQFENKSEQITVLSEGDKSARVDIRTINNNIVDDRETDRIVYTGEWDLLDEGASFNGTETDSKELGAAAEFIFYGTGVNFIGSKQASTGDADIFIDGNFMEKIDTYNNLGSDLKQTTIYTIDNLSYGEHKIRIETAGGKNNCIVVDCFEVIGGVERNEERVLLIINSKWNYPSLGWGNYIKSSQTLEINENLFATIRLG